MRVPIWSRSGGKKLAREDRSHIFFSHLNYPPSPLPSNAHEICSPSSWGLSGVGGGSFHLPPLSPLFTGSPCMYLTYPASDVCRRCRCPSALLSLRHATAGNTCETRPRYLSLSVHWPIGWAHDPRARPSLVWYAGSTGAGCQTFPSEFLNPIRYPHEPLSAQPMPVYP